MPPETSQLVTDLSNGFFGGLAAAGVKNINPGPLEFEAAFARSWAAWLPAFRPALAAFSAGRYGFRVLLYRARCADSVFRNYRTHIEARPYGTGNEQFLRTWAPQATPEEWRDLGLLYLGNNGAHPRSGNEQNLAHHLEKSVSLPPTKVPVIGKYGVRVPGGLIRR